MGFILIHNKRLIGIVLAVAVLLLIPFLAMKFTGEVNWTPIDFITAGVLLLGTGLAFEFVLRSVRKLGHRIAICAAILFFLFIVWAELAVGLIGTPSRKLESNTEINEVWIKDHFGIRRYV